MERKSNELFNAIDVENLFSQWHPDIRKFTKGINQYCVLNLIKTIEESSFDITKYNSLLNFVNTENCKKTLNRVLEEKNTSNFIGILKERDIFYPRDIDRGFSIEEIFKLVQDSNYHPILFLELNKNYYIIDGRTRFYCCIFLNIPAKVRILKDSNLLETCKNK